MSWHGDCAQTYGRCNNDQAGIAAFLASPASDFVTGAAHIDSAMPGSPLYSAWHVAMYLNNGPAIDTEAKLLRSTPNACPDQLLWI